MDSNNLYDTWQRVIAQVKGYDSVNPVQVDAFFGRLTPQAISDGFLIVTADTEFIKMQVEKRFMTAIQQALLDLFGIDYLVEIEVDPTAAPAAPAPAPAPAAPAATPAADHPEPAAPATTVEPPARTASPTDHTKTHVAPHEEPRNDRPRDERPSRRDEEPQGTRRPSDDAGLASSLTFENFVIGDSNRLAYSMAVAVAEAPGKPNLNPLFIYGKSGLGKTHLLRAIQNYVLETNPSMHVVYIDSSEFLSDYTSAVAAHDKNKDSYQNFQKRYLDADVLLIDDVQYFQGKSATVDIVFQLFNKLTAQGRQVVLSADRAPKMIDIDERYKSRFNSGGTFDIQPPEVETKLGIIKGFIEEYKRAEDSYDFYVPEDIQMYIAEISSSNVRELKSAVTKVISQITYFNNPDITLADVKLLLENHFSSGMTRRLSVSAIQKEVEQFYKVSHADLVGSKRSRNIMYARQVAIYLCRQMLDIPYNDIGKKFNRDHSTVMYSVEKIEDRLRESRELQEELEIIIKNIREN
ncbi:chromosomal replication initiator protein DnaA [uncultured Slackia sp.]|uniref:chromosomal replication initiator protein DnaA n=1 Tax=uncultured Slackia sp. TaxID=665903 RepID=UPI0025F838BE|nr:chromosomal replication initiator protein DnaA [uncultured Slackia sp.]